MGTPADVNLRLRRLPKVDEVLHGEAAQALLERAPRWAVVEAIRAEIELLRERLLAAPRSPEPPATAPQHDLSVAPEALRERVGGLLRPSLGRVLNATGVVLHTNLGRAPLAEPAVRRIVEVARGYSNL